MPLELIFIFERAENQQHAESDPDNRQDLGAPEKQVEKHAGDLRNEEFRYAENKPEGTDDEKVRIADGTVKVFEKKTELIHGFALVLIVKCRK